MDDEDMLISCVKCIAVTKPISHNKRLVLSCLGDVEGYVQ